MIRINLKKKELSKKRTFTKKHDWLINHIPEPIQKTVGGVKY